MPYRLAVCRTLEHGRTTDGRRRRCCGGASLLASVASPGARTGHGASTVQLPKRHLEGPSGTVRWHVEGWVKMTLLDAVPSRRQPTVGIGPTLPALEQAAPGETPSWPRWQRENGDPPPRHRRRHCEPGVEVGRSPARRIVEAGLESDEYDWCQRRLPPVRAYVVELVVGRLVLIGLHLPGSVRAALAAGIDDDVEVLHRCLGRASF